MSLNNRDQNGSRMNVPMLSGGPGWGAEEALYEGVNAGGTPSGWGIVGGTDGKLMAFSWSMWDEGPAKWSLSGSRPSSEPTTVTPLPRSSLITLLWHSTDVSSAPPHTEAGGDALSGISSSMSRSSSHHDIALPLPLGDAEIGSSTSVPAELAHDARQSETKVWRLHLAKWGTAKLGAHGMRTSSDRLREAATGLSGDMLPEYNCTKEVWGNDDVGESDET